MEDWSEAVQNAPDDYYPPLEIDEEEESIIAESTTSDPELSAALDERQNRLKNKGRRHMNRRKNKPTRCWRFREISKKNNETLKNNILKSDLLQLMLGAQFSFRWTM